MYGVIILYLLQVFYLYSQFRMTAVLYLILKIDMTHNKILNRIQYKIDRTSTYFNSFNVHTRIHMHDVI